MQKIIDNIQCSKEYFNRVDEVSNFEKCLCLECRIEIKHEILINIKNHIIYEDEYLRLYEFYQIIKCINCGDISFRKEIMNPADISMSG